MKRRIKDYSINIIQSQLDRRMGIETTASHRILFNSVFLRIDYRYLFRDNPSNDNSEEIYVFII